MDETAWEKIWAPYDQPTYQAVLEFIRPGDTILEIGAGDLRLARQIAGIARQVFAIEIQRPVLEQGLAALGGCLPANLVALHGDAREIPFFPGITAAVLLMRHCSHFRLYADKLISIRCGRLITNARWRMGVEQIWLAAPRESYADVKIGWYACWCGAAGYKPGRIDEITLESDAIIHEVIDCPSCLLEYACSCPNQNRE